MKKIGMTLLVMIAGLFCVQSVSAASPKKVGVYVEGKISADERTIISSSVMSRISTNKDYVAFERNKDFLNGMTKEVDWQLSGEVPVSEIREVGARLGVDYVIVIDVVIKRDVTYMSGELIELETGRVIKSLNGERDGNDVSVLKALATNIAYRLLSNKSK